jgi:hypothetical protein
LNVHWSSEGLFCASLSVAQYTSFESWVEAAMARMILELEWVLRGETAPTCFLRLSQAESNKEEQQNRKT